MMVPMGGWPHGGTVLVASATAALRERWRVGLELEGFDVVVTDSGRAAMQALEDASRSAPHIECVVYDVTMPDHDAQAFLRFVASFGVDVPVLLAVPAMKRETPWRAAIASWRSELPLRIDIVDAEAPASELAETAARWIDGDASASDDPR